MNHSKIAIFLLTLLLLFTAVFFFFSEMDWNDGVEMTLELPGQEIIGCWTDDTGACFFFLPSYADLSQIQLRTNTYRSLQLGQQTVTDRMTCESLELDKPYDLIYDGDIHYTLTFCRSANVPTMYIDTASGSMQNIHKEKGNDELATMRLYSSEGELYHSGIISSIQGRGNATWNNPKKSYSLNLPKDADLLGMGSASRWILLSNSADSSNMRNKLAYDLAVNAGLSYSPNCQWVDVYLNGGYAGLYLLSERNEIHPQRIAIPEDGSFLVSMELQSRLEEQNYPFVTTQSGLAFRIHHAGMDHSRIQQVLQSAENAIISEDGIDPDTGLSWQTLLDIDSWVQKYLMEEITVNFDGGVVSQFFYYDGEKLYAGPIWDYDNTLGVGAWQNGYPQILTHRKHIVSTEDSPWFYWLYQKESFAQQVCQTYESVFRPQLQSIMDEQFSYYTETISQAANLNNFRHNNKDFGVETAKLYHFLSERIAFLDSIFIQKEFYHHVYLNNYCGYWVCLAVRPGEYLPDLTAAETEVVFDENIWYNIETDLPVDVKQPIYEDMMLQYK